MRPTLGHEHDREPAQNRAIDHGANFDVAGIEIGLVKAARGLLEATGGACTVGACRAS